MLFRPANPRPRLSPRAQDELTAKQMSAFAWVRAARGELAAASGDDRNPSAHYRPATAAYTGYWFIESHVAALLRQEGRLGEAAAASAAVCARTVRPEPARALGDVHRLRGEDHSPARWYVVAGGLRCCGSAAKPFPFITWPA